LPREAGVGCGAQAFGLMRCLANPRDRGKVMMKSTLVMLCAAGIGGGLLFAAPAQAQKSAKDCSAEWTARKAANVTGDQKRAAFIKECRGTAAGPVRTPPASGAQATPPA